ncbi:MAG: DinB family protein [Chloroflexota bacterium]
MNAVDIIKYGHSFLNQSMDGLQDSDWEISGACGVWSPKDIMAHLASYEHLLCEVLTSFLGGGATPYMEQMAQGHGFNDAQVALRKGNSVKEVLNEYNATFAEVTALIPRIPIETCREVGTLPWYGMEYALDDYIVYAFYGHKREHGGQIALFRDRPR